MAGEQNPEVTGRDTGLSRGKRMRLEAMRYHGDFHWPGIAIANQLVQAVGVQPWRMTADDYVAAPASLDLAGAVTEPLWDADLGAAIRHRGLVVHEEAVLPELLPLL